MTLTIALNATLATVNIMLVLLDARVGNLSRVVRAIRHYISLTARLSTIRLKN